MKLQHLIIIFVIIMLPVILVLSEYVGSQIDTLATKTRLDTSLLGATYDTMAAYELNTRNISTSSVVGEDIRELEAVISAFTRSLSSSMGLTGVSNDYILSHIPAIAFCMYDGYYIYMPNEPTSGDEKLQPYVYYSKNYVNGNTNITIAFSLDNYVSIYGTSNGEPISAAGYLVVPGYVDYDNNFAYLKTTGEDGRVEYKVVKGGVKYKNIDITKETIKENVPLKNSKEVYEKEEETTDAMLYYYQAEQFTELYNGIVNKLKEDDKKVLCINEGNDPEDETSAFNNEKVNVIKDALTSNLNRAIYNYEGTNPGTIEMPQLNGEDWDKILNNISIVAFMKDMPLNNGTTYNNYVVVNSTVTQKYTSAKSLNFIGYKDSKSAGYYHKITCKEFLEKIKNNDIEGITGYSAVDFERYKGAAEDDKEYYYYYKHNEYADYDCEVKPAESVNVATLNNYLLNVKDNSGNKIFPIENDITKNIEREYYTAIARIRFRQVKASSYINLENDDEGNFNVEFDLDSGEWSGNEPNDEGKIIKDSKYNKYEIPIDTPTIPGKFFYGWEIKDSGIIAKPGDILYAEKDTTLELKANYKNGYSINYFDDENELVKWDNKLENVDIAVSRDFSKVIETGKEFVGWVVYDRESDATEKITIRTYDVASMNDPNEWIIKDNINLYLYPMYSTNSYRLSYYDRIGGNSESGVYPYGTEKEIKKVDPDSIPGYTFLGWGSTDGQTEPDDKYTAEELNKGVEEKITQNMTLYAKWKPKTYTLRFHKDENDSQIQTIKVDAGSSFSKNSFDGGDDFFLREGYKYDGISLSKDGTISNTITNNINYIVTINDAFIQEYLKNSDEVDFYLQWKSDTWTITYADRDGGENIIAPTVGKYNINNNKYSITVSSDIPEKNKYTFQGWETEDGSKKYSGGETIIEDKLPSNMTLYALWSRESITVTYYADNDKNDKFVSENEKIGDINVKSQEETGLTKEMDVFEDGNKVEYQICRWIYKYTENGAEKQFYVKIGDNLSEYSNIVTITTYENGEIKNEGLINIFDDVELYADWEPRNQYYDLIIYDYESKEELTSISPAIDKKIEIDLSNGKLNIYDSNYIFESSYSLPKKEGFRIKTFEDLDNKKTYSPVYYNSERNVIRIDKKTRLYVTWQEK